MLYSHHGAHDSKAIGRCLRRADHLCGNATVPWSLHRSRLPLTGQPWTAAEVLLTAATVDMTSDRPLADGLGESDCHTGDLRKRVVNSWRIGTSGMNTAKKAPSRIEYAQALLQGRLHRAAGDKRCGCGACAHQVAVVARRAGITSAELVAAMEPVAKPDSARSRGRAESRVRICDSATIRRRGADAPEGMAVFLARLHDSG